MWAGVDYNVVVPSLNIKEAGEMRVMKRIILISLILIYTFIILFVGCDGNPEDSGHSEVIQVYTSVYPLFDFTQKIGGHLVDVHHVVPPGVEAHDFEPTPKGMAAIMDADLFVYNGAGFEAWAERAVDLLAGRETHVVNTTEQLDLLSLNEDSHHGELDPHVWLDPQLAKQQAQAIAEALMNIDPDHKDVYEANFIQLAAQFDTLDQELQEITNRKERKEIVVSHAAFGYLANRYGLQQIAVSGRSSSAEPSQKDIERLIDFVKQHHIPYIMFEPLVSPKTANVVKEEAGVQALILHPLENLTEEELARGEDYFTIMEQNKQNLAKAVGSEVGRHDGTSD